MMGLTPGDHLRRLRDISERFVRAAGAAAPSRRRRAREGVGAPSVEELQDNPTIIDEWIDELMEAAMHRLSMKGTSVSATAERMAEAVRRGLVRRDPVPLAFELADHESDKPPGDHRKET